MVGGEWGFSKDLMGRGAQNALSEIKKKTRVFQVLS